jgi:type IV pilus assembly protein PilN
MIRINLLPFRAARKKENVRRQVSIFLLSLLLVTVAVIFFNFRLSNKINTLNTVIADTKAQVEKYNKINEEIDDIKRKLEVLNKKITVIETLEANRRDSITLLDAMTKLIMVDRMWFTLLRTKEDSVDVTGIALDNRTVADFMTRLEFSDYYANVNLKTIKQEAIAGKNINLKHYNITFTKAPLAKPDTKKAKDS